MGTLRFAYPTVTREPSNPRRINPNLVNAGARGDVECLAVSVAEADVGCSAGYRSRIDFQIWPLKQKCTTNARYRVRYSFSRL